MITFQYVARGSAGEVVQAEVQAESEQAAAKLLISQNLFPVSIEQKKDEGNWGFLKIGGHVKAKQRVIFTRQLATLINAGLPLIQSLRTVSGQISNKNLQTAVQQIVADIEGGSTLNAAFARFPKIFNQTYISLIAAGETSGSLDKALERIADQQEKDAAVTAKIRGAMVYPIIVLAVLIGVLMFMLTTVLPQIAQLYKDLKKDLPVLTKGLISVSTFLTKFWWLVLIMVIAAAVIFRNFLKTEAGGRWLDRIKISVPILGPLVQKLYMARFARTLGTLLGSGIPMLEAMEVVRAAVNNQLVNDAILRSMDKVRAGKALSTSLEQEPRTFAILVPQMVKIGEQSGAIDDMLLRVANFYEEEVDNAIKNLSTTIEPALMVVLGITVGVVIMAILFPVYSLVGKGLT